MTKTFYAIIPARSGSKGLPNKNVKLLNGHPLMSYSIAAAKLCPNVSRVIVSTDSEEYAEIARAYGAEAPFLRPKEMSADKSSDFDFFQHCINWFEKNEGKNPDYWLHLRPTTPIRDVETIERAINLVKSADGYTSLRSAHECAESPYKWFKINADGYFTNLEDNLNVDGSNSARQEYPKVFIPNGYVDIIKTSFVIEHEKIHGNRVLAFETPSCIEIDTIDEFNYLEFVTQNNKDRLQLYLDGVIND